MPKGTPSGPDDVAVNPAGFAFETRETAAPVADDFLRDESGNPVAPKSPKEEQRAKIVGQASAHAVMDDRISDVLADHIATHDGQQAELNAAEPRRQTIEQLYEDKAQSIVEIGTVPDSSISSKRKVLAIVAKLAFFLGDSAALAALLYRSGSPIWLSVLIGVSMSATMIGAGSQAGKEEMLLQQRRNRGQPPEGCPYSVIGFYDDGEGTEQNRAWLYLGALAAGGLLLAITLIGIGAGDEPALAFGFGLLAALTFVGSAATEAYATNAVADRLQALLKQLKGYGDQLLAFEAMEYRAAHAGSLGRSLNTAAHHGATATGSTVSVIANRTVDSPNIYGYEDEGNMTIPVDTPVPQPLEIEKGLSVSPEKRTRRNIALNRPFRSKEAAAENDVDLSDRGDQPPPGLRDVS